MAAQGNSLLLAPSITTAFAAPATAFANAREMAFIEPFPGMLSLRGMTAQSLNDEVEICKTGQEPAAYIVTLPASWQLKRPSSH